MGQMSLARWCRDEEGQRGGRQLGPSVQTARILRTAGRIPAALALHSLHAGGLWAVINDYPMASIKAKGKGSVGCTDSQRGLAEGGEGHLLLGPWRQKVFRDAMGDKKGTGLSFAPATPLVMIVLTGGKSRCEGFRLRRGFILRSHPGLLDQVFRGV